MEDFTITIEKPLKIKKLIQTSSLNRGIVTAKDPRQFEHNSSYNRDRMSNKAADDCLAEAEKQFAIAKQLHEENIVAIEHNKRNGEILKKLLTDIGLRTVRDVKTTTRSGKAKWHKEYSTWVTDIVETYVMSDGFATEENSFEEAKKNCIEYKKKILLKEAEEKRKQDIENAERKANKDLIKLQIKYECDDSIEDWNDLLYFLCQKDQYVKLAVAMYRTRCDWNDGFGKVEYALGNFEIINDQDKEIFNCVQDLCYSDEQDGRIFRDCEWNYDVLFDLVENQELLQDTRLCLENIS